MVDNDSIDMDDKCCICFYPLVTEICRLDCNHQFHFNCLTEWQKKKKENTKYNLSYLSAKYCY